MKKIFFFTGLLFLSFCSFGQMKETSGDINFRTSPEIKENKICIIPKGTVISIIQDTVEYENWTKISYDGKTGYVNNTFLKDISTVSDKNNNSFSSSSSNGVKYYKNLNGEKIQSPTKYDSAPIGATAECNDGTYSFSKSRRGTCSHHGGVKRWLK